VETDNNIGLEESRETTGNNKRRNESVLLFVFKDL
jgi:hypothetical protein